MEEARVREVIRCFRDLPFHVKYVVRGPHTGPFKKEDVAANDFTVTQVGGSQDFDVKVEVSADDLYSFVENHPSQDAKIQADKKTRSRIDMGDDQPRRKALDPSDPQNDEMRMVKDDMGFTKLVTKEEAEAGARPRGAEEVADVSEAAEEEIEEREKERRNDTDVHLDEDRVEGSFREAGHDARRSKADKAKGNDGDNVKPTNFERLRPGS